MKRLAILALLGAAAAISTAQTPDNEQTGGLKNGRWWTGRSEVAKLYYLVGLADGLGAADTAVTLAWPVSKDTPPKLFEWLFPANATFGETVKGLNQFYDDPANLAISVQRAMVLFREKIQGMDPATLAEDIAASRKAAAR